jgi:glycosyltransferase involved in cell wall biosynthesis
MNLSNVTIIVPCYNEEDNLPRVLPIIVDFINNFNCNVLLVNDGSKDGTPLILQEAINNTNIKVISHSKNRGYGAAIKSGILACSTPYCITIDGDGQHDLNDIPRLVAVLETEQADLVIGNRMGKGSSNFRNLGKWIIKKLTKTFIEIEISDLNSGMKLYRTKVATSLIKWAPNDMSYSETISLLHSHFRYKVLEQDIHIFNREAGQSTINYKTAIRTVKEILFLIINFFPFRFFGLVGILFMTFGALWSIPFLLNGEGLTIGAGFILSFGFLVFIQGIILQTLTRLKFEGYTHINN